MKLIIQIPCLNEEADIAAVLEELPERFEGIGECEVVVIDDGSTDDTASVVLRSASRISHHVHLTKHRRNRGLAAAFQTGIDVSIDLGADVIVNLDGDGQYPAEEIDRLIEPILSGAADMVIGDRKPELCMANTRVKRWLYRLGRWGVGHLLQHPIPDATSGFRAFSSECAFAFHRTTAYSYTLETLATTLDNGFSIRFVPIESRITDRPSRLYRSLVGFLYRSGETLIRVAFARRPLRLLLPMAICLGLVGVASLVRFLILFGYGDGDGHTQSIVIGTGLCVSALMVFLTAALAELLRVNRILLERLASGRQLTSRVISRTPATSNPVYSRQMAPSHRSDPCEV